MTLTNDGKGLKSQSRLRKLRCFRESFKHRHTERDKDLQYSSCLLVIGTFQTGYCRVNIDRKLLAGDCENHHQCTSWHVQCPDASIICKLCRSMIPMMAKTLLCDYISSLFSAAVKVKAWPVPGSPAHTIPRSRDLGSVGKMFSLANQGVTFYTMPALMSLFTNPVAKTIFFLQIQQSI